MVPAPPLWTGGGSVSHRHVDDYGHQDNLWRRHGQLQRDGEAPWYEHSRFWNFAGRLGRSVPNNGPRRPIWNSSWRRTLALFISLPTYNGYARTYLYPPNPPDGRNFAGVHRDVGVAPFPASEQVVAERRIVRVDPGNLAAPWGRGGFTECSRLVRRWEESKRARRQPRQSLAVRRFKGRRHRRHRHSTSTA